VKASLPGASLIAKAINRRDMKKAKGKSKEGLKSLHTFTFYPLPSLAPLPFLSQPLG
jgi:hypothetical protein